ncbi:MAG: hypothetical protein ABJD53_13515 [Gammaproteobacteria bacterium]
MALWLLKWLGSPYHGESLAGDLIEQCQQGRSRAWCWRQVIASILYARVRFIPALPRRAAIKALLLAFGVLALGVGTITWALTAP